MRFSNDVLFHKRWLLIIYNAGMREVKGWGHKI